MMNLKLKVQFLVYLFGIYFISACGKETETSRTGKISEETKEDTTQIQGRKITSFPYAIQVAAFKEKSNAEKLSSKLQKSDLQVYISAKKFPEKGILYRVWLGPFTKKTSATKALMKAKELGYSNAFLIRDMEEPKINFAKQDTDTVRLKSDESKKQLTFNGGCQYPQWSPKGREIAFFTRDSVSEGIFSIGTGGGYISQIIVSTKKRRITPKFVWSPFGDRLALVVIEKSPSRRTVENLYLINKNGSSLVNLISQDRNAFEIEDLQWAPDGQLLAFNANYGGVDAHSDILQKVKIITLNQQIEELTFAKGTQWCAGWYSEKELVFLSTYAGMNYSHNFGYEVWSYNVKSNERTKILGGPAVKNCQSVKIIPNKNKLVYSYFAPLENPTTGSVEHQTSKILILDLITGMDEILFESQYTGKLDSRLLVSSNGEVLFFYDGQLWRSHLLGSDMDAQALTKTRMATLSPNHKKLCFVEMGNLFILILNLTKKEAE